LVIVGDTIHNFIDGVAIAASFLINPGLGLITAVSTFLHEVPHEIGDFGILLKAGWQRSHIFLVNLISASFSILGAILVVFVIPSEYLLGLLLAVAAGLFLYLGSSDFLPHADEGLTKNKAMASLLVGTTIMLSVFWLIPHSHPEGDDHQEVVQEADEHMTEEFETNSADPSEQELPSANEELEVEELQGYL
jgi:zinc and cadmium transporter